MRVGLEWTYAIYPLSRKMTWFTQREKKISLVYQNPASADSDFDKKQKSLKRFCLQRETHVQSAIINWVGRKHASYWSIFLDSIDKLHWCSFNCRYLPCICSVDILDDSFVLCLCSFVCSPHYMLSNHFLHINQGTALDILPLFYHESYQYPKKLINLFFLFKSSIAHTWRKKLVVF